MVVRASDPFASSKSSSYIDWSSSWYLDQGLLFIGALIPSQKSAKPCVVWVVGDWPPRAETTRARTHITHPLTQPTSAACHLPTSSSASPSTCSAVAYEQTTILAPCSSAESIKPMLGGGGNDTTSVASAPVHIDQRELFPKRLLRLMLDLVVREA